ncbi:hypothetical protein [Halobaculum litoreum]|uniref:Uncharacterized protein n=1 Tax=Halobaculum litoreum TaxID=3031998 RepID=A0ABD5XL47_9EURY|nr:hypothetical protein [Halobaculum sp. DT92]
MSVAPADVRRALLPLSDRPRYWRPLLAGYAALTAGFVLVTVAVAALGFAPLSGRLYDLALPAVLFLLPPVVGAAAALLGGGLLPAAALGATPSLAWAATALVVGWVRLLAGADLPPADSPLWAITLAFLVIGVCGALAGFAVGRVALLGWRRRPARGDR